MKTFSKYFLLMILLGLFAAPVSAEASECDILTDATPGLFGLCTAYCDAQNCDQYAEGDEPRSCTRLLANYDRKKTGSDPDMPCNESAVSCPCWGMDELTAGGMGLTEALCTNSGGAGTEIASWFTPPDSIIFRVDGTAGISQTSCTYGNTMTSDVPVSFDTTEDQDAECRAGLLAVQQDFAFCIGL